MIEFIELQIKTGTSNKGLAHLLGVPVTTIANWKYGKCGIPKNVMEKMRQYSQFSEIVFKI